MSVRLRPSTPLNADILPTLRIKPSVKVLGLVKPGLITVLLMTWVITACTTREATPTPFVEPTVPPQFATYSDELGAFTISYPASWEQAASVMESMEKLSKAALKSILTEEELDAPRMVFLAGVPTSNGFDPSVSVTIGPISGLDVDELVTASVRDLKENVIDYHEISRVRTMVDGRDAFILDTRWTPPYRPLPLAFLQMRTIEGKVDWLVTCGTEPETFVKIRETCDQVVRSLRVLAK